MSGRDELLAAARRCLARDGWGAPTVRDVAAEAGMSHASIGYHFGSRDALMTEALIEAVGEMGREISAIDASGGVGQWQALLDTARTHRAVWLAQLEAVRHAQHSPEVRRLLRAGQRQAQDGLGGAVAQALLVGLVVQSLVDPKAAVSASDLPAALRELAGP